MKRTASIFVLATLVMACISCNRARIIPPSKLAAIYEEMFVADQWIRDNHKNAQADTSLVYEPIFRKYGYTSRDYRRTVDRYLDNPEKFERVLDRTSESMKARLQGLRDIQVARFKADSARRVRLGRDYLRPVPYASLLKGTVPTDSLRMVLDSNGIWQLSLIEKDTMFRGPEMIVAERHDTVAIEAAVDAPAVPDVAIPQERRVLSDIEPEEVPMPLNKKK